MALQVEIDFQVHGDPIGLLIQSVYNPIAHLSLLIAHCPLFLCQLLSNILS
jgi:hypothetical protein